jgi:hypothetical protein
VPLLPKRQFLKRKKGAAAWYSLCYCIPTPLTDFLPFCSFFSFSFACSRNKSGATHNTGYKTRSRKNRLGTSDVITGTKVEKRMKLLMGVN